MTLLVTSLSFAWTDNLPNPARPSSTRKSASISRTSSPRCDDRVEANVRYQLEDEYNLDEKPDDDVPWARRRKTVEAIELEAVDGNDWDDGYEQYITGVGYTIVNRLAAFAVWRCGLYRRRGHNLP